MLCFVSCVGRDKFKFFAQSAACYNQPDVRYTRTVATSLGIVESRGSRLQTRRVIVIRVFAPRLLVANDLVKTDIVASRISLTLLYEYYVMYLYVDVHNTHMNNAYAYVYV